MSKSLRTLMRAAAVVTVLAASTGPALADTWQQDHPRRAEVNRRLGNQSQRISRAVRNGTMSRGRAAQLHHEDHQIRNEERAMASQDRSHITRNEKRVLNEQENHVSRQINR